MRAFSAALLVVLLVAPSIRADVLWSTYGSGYVTTYLTEPTHENAENFVLPNVGQITGVTWTGIYINNTLPTDNFDLKLFADAGGKPGTTEIDTLTGTLTRTDTHTTVDGREAYDYTISLSSPLTLSPGTYYFDPIDVITSDAFYWAVVSFSGNFWVRDTPNPGVWIENNSNDVPSTMAFSVQGTLMPLPSSAWGGLALLGGLGLTKVLRRRWSAAA